MDPNHDLGFDLNEALKRTNISKDDLEAMRKQLPENAPVDMTDKQLLLFLNSCGSIENALNVIKIYYESRKKDPEHFNNRDPKDAKIKQCLDNQYYFVIPPSDKEGCPYVYHKIANPNSSNYIFDNAVKTYLMSMDVAMYKYGPRPGIIFLHDMEHVGFYHMLRASISSIRKFLHYVQYGMPAKIRRIHVFNVTPLFNKILALVRPFVKKELIEMIHTHPTDMDFNEFFNEWVPKSHIPSDYGGDMKSIQELHDEFCEELVQMRDYFLSEEQQRQNIVEN